MIYTACIRNGRHAAFQFYMPVTLVVSTNLYPKYEEFAFGLTVLALSVGTIPVFGGFIITEGLLQ